MELRVRRLPAQPDWVEAAHGCTGRGRP